MNNRLEYTSLYNSAFTINIFMDTYHIITKFEFYFKRYSVWGKITIVFAFVNHLMINLERILSEIHSNTIPKTPVACKTMN